MSYPRYPAYKDSGVEWLAAIPTHWEVVRNKVLFNEFDIRSTNGDEELLTVSHITGVTPRSEKNVNMIMAETLEGYKKCEVGDLVINTMWAWMGAVGLTGYDGLVSPSYNVYRPRNHRVINRWYFDYLYRIPAHIIEMTRFSKGIWDSRLRLYPDAFGSMFSPLPPSNEQAIIAAFLDRETAKIAVLIAKQERLIALLQEKRKALIAHAVTKGLDADVAMKDSGVAWLEEIPAHWELTKVKYEFQILDGRRIPLNSEERSLRQGDYAYYGASGIIDYIDDFLFDQDLILVGEDGANLLNRATPIAFIARGKYWVNNHAHILQPKDGQIVYWQERLEQIDYSPWVTGSAQPKLTVKALANVTIACPSSNEERSAIAAYIDQERPKFDRLIAKARQAITLMIEHRTALITAAVTGQIDVRGVVEMKEIGARVLAGAAR